MKREYSILKNYLLYFLVFYIVCAVGISKVFAYDYDNIGYFNDKTQVQVEVNYANNPISVPINATYQLAQVYSLDMFVSNINLDPSFVYWFEIYLPNTILTNANSVSVIDQTTGHNNSQCTILTSYFGNNYPHVTFQCSANSNITSLYIRYYNANNQYLFEPQIFTWNYTYMRKRVPDSANDTGEIKDAISQSTQDIINNQDKNFNDCGQSKNLYIGSLESGSFNSNTGELIPSTTRVRSSSYLDVSNGDYTFSINNNSDYRIVVYVFDSTNNYLSSESKTSWQNLPFTMTLSDNRKIKFAFKKSDETDIIPRDITSLSVSKYRCVNRLDETKDAINGLTGAITDDSPINMDSLGDTAGWLPPGPIDSIINLPLNLFNNLLLALNKTCQPLNVPLPYVDRNLPIPCISTIFNQIDGLPNFWNWVGAISSVIILYRYLLALYKYYDDLTTMKANFISDFGGAP